MTDDSVRTGQEITPAAPQNVRPRPVLPPHPLDTEWYMRVDGQDYGPFSGHSLGELARDGRLQPDTDVIRVGGQIWVKASEERALAPFFTSYPLSAPRDNAETAPGRASAGNGSTVVQVNNHLPPHHPQTVVIDGAAKAKSPGLAFFLSFLIVGLGQLYNGEVGKGLLMFVGCILLWLIMLGWVIMIWSWIDAYQTAKAMNERYQRRLAAGLA